MSGVVVTSDMEGNVPGIEATHRIVMDEAAQASRKAGNLVLREARLRAPFRTGHLRRSLNARVEQRGTEIHIVVGTNVEYGLYLEKGTGLYGPLHHWIVPKRAQALRWPAGGQASLFVGGRRVSGSAGPGFTLAGRVRSGRAGRSAAWMFAKRVRGVRPRHFMADAEAITRPQVTAIFNFHATRVAERIEAASARGKVA